MRYLYRRTFHLFLIAALAVGMVGCDSLTSGYDEDPNAPREAKGDLLFNGAAVGAITFHEANLARTTGMFTNQFTGQDRQYNRINLYNVNASDFDNSWATGYSDTINELVQAKEQARNQSKPVLENFSRILEAYTFGTTTSIWGDVPFNNVSQGRENLNPQFDAQADIYANIQDSLDAAINELQPYVGGQGPIPFDLAFGDASLDPFYGGDVQRWIDFAWTLKARYYLHTGNYADALNATQNGISSRDGNLVAPHGGSFAVNLNIWSDFFFLRSGYLGSSDAYAPDLLASRQNAKTLEFNRGWAFYPGEFIFQIFGTAVELAPALGGFGTADFPLVRYAENELIEAEAALQANGTSGISTALTALNNARKANEDYLGAGGPVDQTTLGMFGIGVTSLGLPGDNFYQDYVRADFQSGGMSYTTPSGVSTTEANALLTEILEEKYLTLIGQIEAFADMRRTDNFLEIPLKPGRSNLPQRLPYPQIEVSANSSVDGPGSVFTETPVNSNLNYNAIN